MIGTVTEQASTWAALPYKFEAGTQNIAGAVGLGAAIDYLTAIGMDQVEVHERVLVQTVLPQLLAIEGLTVYGPTDPAKHTGVISFNLGHLHPHDLATALDMEGVAVRAGHHCAQPLMNYLGLEASARASFYLYNTAADAEKLVSALKEAKEFFRIGTI